MSETPKEKVVVKLYSWNGCLVGRFRLTHYCDFPPLVEHDEKLYERDALTINVDGSPGNSYKEVGGPTVELIED